MGLGQGHNSNVGLFGPLPVPEVPDHVGLTYSFFIDDPSCIDPRWKGKSYCILVFLMPESLIKLFNDREKVKKILEAEIENLKSIGEIDRKFFKMIRFSVLQLNYNNKN